MIKKNTAIPAMLLLSALAAGCDSGNDHDQDLQATPGGGTQTSSLTGSNNPAILALTDDGTVVRFNANTPGTITATVNITGVQHDGSDSPFPVAFGVRHSSKTVYALYSDGRLYTVQTTGALTLVGRPAFPSSARIDGMHFDPVADTLRALSDQDDHGNFRVNPADGSIAATDTALAYASGDDNAAKSPSAEDVAYTGGAGATSTTAYVLDTTQDVLARLGSPGGSPDSANSGKLTTVGAFGTAIGGGGAVGFDIPSGDATVGYVSDGSDIYKVDLTSGHLTKLGTVTGKHVIDIALVPGTGNGSTTPPPTTPPPTTPPPSLGVAPGDGLCTLAMAGPSFKAEVGEASPACFNCGITPDDAAPLIDTDFDNSISASLTGISLADPLLGEISAAVSIDGSTVKFVPSAAGAFAGGVFSLPGGDPGQLALGPGITLETLLDGAVVETSEFLSSSDLAADLMGEGVLIADQKFAVTMPVTQPFNGLRVRFDAGTIGLNTTINMFYACASAPAESGFPAAPLP